MSRQCYFSPRAPSCQSATHSRGAVGSGCAVSCLFFVSLHAKAAPSRSAHSALLVGCTRLKHAGSVMCSPPLQQPQTHRPFDRPRMFGGCGTLRDTSCFRIAFRHGGPSGSVPELILKRTELSQPTCAGCGSPGEWRKLDFLCVCTVVWARGCEAQGNCDGV